MLTSLASWGLNHWFVHRAAIRRDARYLAHRVAIILEKFALDCARVIEDNRSQDDARPRHLALPVLGTFPDDADWKAIAPVLLDRVISMPNEQALAEQTISFW